jgi:hypothetical protein
MLGTTIAEVSKSKIYRRTIWKRLQLCNSMEVLIREVLLHHACTTAQSTHSLSIPHLETMHKSQVVDRLKHKICKSSLDTELPFNNRQSYSSESCWGMCIILTCAWEYLNKLTTQARYMEVIRSGHWQYIREFDMNEKVYTCRASYT